MFHPTNTNDFSGLNSAISPGWMEVVVHENEEKERKREVRTRLGLSRSTWNGNWQLSSRYFHKNSFSNIQ